MSDQTTFRDLTQPRRRKGVLRGGRKTMMTAISVAAHKRASILKEERGYYFLWQAVDALMGIEE